MSMLPFTQAQFLANIASYGQTVWPLQLGALALGLLAVAMVMTAVRRSDVVVLAALALMWAVTGVGYHLVFFTRINVAAYIFGALFVVQAVLFAYAALGSGRLRFGLPGGASSAIGIGLIVYAIALYPAIGWALGHAYLEIPAFGVTPCPVTLFTFGILLLTVSPVPVWLLVIPLLWSLIGGTAAFLLEVPQDWILLFSGAVSITVLQVRQRDRRTIGASQT